MDLSALTSGTPTTTGAQGAQASQATAGAPAAPDVPEGGVSLFTGVLPKAMIGSTVGAVAGFILPWGGPIIGGLLGGLAGAGLQVFKNYRTIKSIQEYNAAALVQTGTAPTSEEELTALAAGQVPDAATTQAGLGSMIQQAATQQAATQGTATGATPAGQTGVTTGTTGATTGTAGATGSTGGTSVASQYQMLVTPKGNFVVPKAMQIPTASSPAEEAQVYAMLQEEHDKAVAAIEAAKAGSTGAGVSQQPSQQPTQAPGAVSQEPVQQVAPDPTGVDQNQGATAQVPSATGVSQAAAGAGAGGAVDPGLAELQQTLAELEEATRRLEEEVERLREERLADERRRAAA